MPNDIQGGAAGNRPLSPATIAAAAKSVSKSTAETPHQSFMTVVGQAIGITLLVEVGSYSPAATRIVLIIIVGLWVAFLVNNSNALFGALTVKRT